MGNTWYLACVLQCIIINLYPIQEYFLHKAKHDHSFCQLLRSISSTKKKTKTDNSPVISNCIGCETDKLFLEYYGSVNGVDMSTTFQISDDVLSKDTKKSSNVKGLPISPTNMLVHTRVCLY
jgi:hypothetical protein